MTPESAHGPITLLVTGAVVGPRGRPVGELVGAIAPLAGFIEARTEGVRTLIRVAAASAAAHELKRWLGMEPDEAEGAYTPWRRRRLQR